MSSGSTAPTSAAAVVLVALAVLLDSVAARQGVEPATPPTEAHTSSDQDTDREVVVVGDVLEEDLALVGGVRLGFSVEYGTRGWGPNQGLDQVTSPAGRFRLRLTESENWDGFRYLDVRAPWPDEEGLARTGGGTGIVDLSAPFGSGVNDVVDVVLQDRLAPRWKAMRDCFLLEVGVRGARPAGRAQPPDSGVTCPAFRKRVAANQVRHLPRAARWRIESPRMEKRAQ